MVNHGRSRGCITCRERRVKCDEAKPECRSCHRLNLSCGGYKTKPKGLKFIDQNRKFDAPGNLQRPLAALNHACMLVPRPLADPDTAVPFFLGHYASLGRYTESARGFFELLIPMHSSQRQDSALSLAVSAVASEMLSLWRPDVRTRQLSGKYYAKAITRLRNTIQDPQERGKPATLLAALALQLYENIAAVYGLRLATCVHCNGATSLLPFVDQGGQDRMTSTYIRRFMIHTEISSAMHQKRLPNKIANSWVSNGIPGAIPDNPSSKLDSIGASVAEFQARYTQLGARCGFMHSFEQTLRELRIEARAIDAQLLIWEKGVPDHWQPLRFMSEQEVHPSIPTYGSVCEVYPSCQIATIWNLWRCQRIVLAKISINLLNTFIYLNNPQVAKSETSGEMEELFTCKQILQQLVDSVCHSIPFYIGNRTKPSSIADFTDPDILFPSYYSLASSDERRLNCESLGPVTSKAEHKRHIVAQGPWQAMCPLSRLLTFFSEDHGQLIARFLRPGQQE